jgi:hypothetical protein
MAIYYVKNGGNDGLDGLSDANAWASLDKVRNANILPGDTVSFKRGSVWRETLEFGRSGTAGNPILFTAYSTGTLPQIRGDDIVTGWTAESSATGSAGENFTDATGSMPLAWWLMAQSSGNRTSSAGANDALVPSASPPTRGTGPHGYFSSEFAKANSQQFNLPESGMSATFPGKNGVANGSITVGAWIRVDAETGSDGGIFGKDTNFQLIIEGSVVIFRVFSAGNAAVAVSGDTGTYAAGSWRHYTCRIIYNAAAAVGQKHECTLFVNGEKKASQFLESRNTFTGDFVVGNATFKSNFDGAVSELFVFNTALTDAQIADIAGKGLDGTRTASGPTVYYKPFPSKPGAVFCNDVPMPLVRLKSDMNAGTEWWDAANGRQYVRLPGDANPSTATMEVAVRTYPVRMQGNINASNANGSYWIIENLWVRGAHKANIFADTGNNNVVRNCVLSHASENGLHIHTYENLSTYGFDAHDNICHTNGACGITIAGTNATSIAGVRIRRNETHHNCWQPWWKEADLPAFTSGIRPIGREVNDCIVEDNWVHDEGNDGNLSHGEGIWFDTVGLNCIGRRNLVERTTSFGIQIEDCNQVELYSNIIVGTIYYPGVAIIRNCDNNKVFNNTLVNCFGGFVTDNSDGSHFTGNQFYNNIISGNTGWVYLANNGTAGITRSTYNKNIIGPNRTNFLKIDGTQYSALSSWETAWGGGSSNSIQTNATFVNAAAGDYRLATGSAGISVGTAIPGGTLDYGKTSFIAATPTIGAFEFASVSEFQINGALIAPKPTVAATNAQTFPARSLAAAIQATKPTIAATVNNQVYVSGFTHEFSYEFTVDDTYVPEFSNDFSYEFTVEDTSDRYVSAAILARKPTIGAAVTQTFPARSITGTLATKKPTAAASISQIFATRSATGTLVAPRPIAAATMSHSFIARFISATIQVRKPTLSASIGQVFQARTITAALAAKKPVITATLTRGVAAPPARTITAALAASRPAIRITLNSVRIVPHSRAPSWRTVNAGNGTTAGVWQAPLDPNALLDYSVSWDDEMSLGDTILTAVLTLDPQATAAGLVIHSESHDTSSVTAWLKIAPAFQNSPGWASSGETHAISCKVSTLAGRIHDRTISLTVRTT